MHFEKIGLIGRFKPLHNGGALMLQAACTHANHLVIGIGSCNKYNARNPFTADATEAMLNAYLTGLARDVARDSKNIVNGRHKDTAPQTIGTYELVRIPDFAHIPAYRDGKKWVETIKAKYGELDVFLTGNPYVAQLLEGTYRIVHPAELIPKENWLRLRATQVRVAMAQGEGWQRYVPVEVARVIERSGLDYRFRQEFGLETLAQLHDPRWNEESIEQEQQHPTEN